MKNPDWVKFANSMGVKGIKVERQADLPAAMADFLAYDDGPVLMEAVVDQNEHVYPMVPGVSNTTQHDTTRHNTTQHNTTRHSTALPSTARANYQLASM